MELRDRLVGLLMSDDCFDGSHEDAEDLAASILGVVADPGDLGDCPRYAAGLYSRSNIEQFVADALETAPDA